MFRFWSLACLILGSITAMSQSAYSLISPNGELVLHVRTNSDKQLEYTLSYQAVTMIKPSTLALEYEGHEAFGDNLKIVSDTSFSHLSYWDMPWGEYDQVENRYRELQLQVEEREGLKRKVNYHFRLYNDGLAFRYQILPWDNVNAVTVKDEHSQFNLTGDHNCWWIPGDWDIYEHLYTESPLSQVDALSKANHSSLAQSYIPENAVSTPVTMKTREGYYMSFHEAALTDYSGMTLKVDNDKYRLLSELVGRPDGNKADIELPFASPWRMVLVADRAGDLIESTTMLNLNEPSKLDDVSWFEPTTYAGIWWDMHINTKAWDLASGKHGATTEYTKEIIDFASRNNIGAILVEGWNVGWEGWFGDARPPGGPFDFVTPYPDYDLFEVVDYGKKKNVDFIMHHETSAFPAAYEKNMDSAFALMQSLGIHAVKTGYVGTLIPVGEYHHGQYMVRHYRKVIETAAKYDVAVNAHEPIKGTGIRRTWPNAIAREGLRGQEFNAWAADGGNPASHSTIVPFTRMLAGPIDYTPGVFKLDLNEFRPGNRVPTTLAHQLGLYIVFYGPVQMLPDLPAHYEAHPEALKFLQDVGVDWSDSKVLDGEIGDFVVIARKERETEVWFVGGVSDENARNVVVDFDFLEEGKTYPLQIWQDGKGAHYINFPERFEVVKKEVKKGDQVRVWMAPGGGFSMRLDP